MIHIDRMTFLRLASVVLVFGSILAMLVLSVERGPWLDEFFTIWMTDPRTALGTAYRERWATDLHPPLYYASVWALRHLVSDDLAPLRLANALPLLIVVPTVVAWCRRRPRDSWGPVFVGLICCCPYFISNFAELRSYFDVMAITGALAVQLRLLRWLEGDLVGSDRRLGLLIACTIVIALNLHFIASVVVAIIIGVEMAGLARARRWRSAALLAVPSLLGTIFLAIALAYLKTRPFALFSGNPGTYLQMIATGFLIGFALNVGVDVALVTALLKRSRTTARGVGWSIAGLIAAMAFLFLESLFGNSLAFRYTLVLVPLGAALAADLGCDALAESRLKIALFFLGGAGLQVAGVMHEIDNKRWLTFADPIAAAVRDCPETRVVGINQHVLMPPSQRQPVSGADQIFALGYSWVSVRHGFNVTTTQENADTIVSPGRCPTLIWSAHDMGTLPDPLGLARRARIRFMGYDPLVAKELRERDQRLIIISAAQASNRIETR